MLAPAAPARSSRAPWFAVAVVAAFAGAAAAFLRNGEAPSPVHDEVEDAAAAAIATEPEASTAAAIDPPDAAGERDDARAEDEDDARRTRLYKARVAALRGDAGAVRELLHATVMDGGAVPEEARLLREACKVLGDRPCAAAVREMYPPEGD